ILLLAPGLAGPGRRFKRRLCLWRGQGGTSLAHCPLPIEVACCCICDAPCCGEALIYITCCMSLSIMVATSSHLGRVGGPLALLNWVWKIDRNLSLLSVPVFQADCTAGRSETALYHFTWVSGEASYWTNFQAADLLGLLL